MKTPEQIHALTDEQLSHELTEARITLESIYPMRCRDVSAYRNLLLAEGHRRWNENVAQNMERTIALSCQGE